MAPTAEGPDSSFPELPVYAYFCWGADPPVAPHGKLSLCFASGSAKVLPLDVAEGSDAHFLCRGVFSFTGSLLEHFCPAADDSRASIFVGSKRGDRGDGGGVGRARVPEGYKVPKLPGMIAKPLMAANEFRETGSTHPSLKQTDCEAGLETGHRRWK